MIRHVVSKRYSLIQMMSALLLCVLADSAYADLDDLESIGPELTPTPVNAPAPKTGDRVSGEKKSNGKDVKSTPVATSGSSAGPTKDITDADSERKSKEPVKFQSSGLSAYREAGTMELEKDVVITQADTKIEADKVKAFYDPKTKEVVKIVATGNVRITKDDPDPLKKAKTLSNEAVFYNKERKVVLKGSPQLIRPGGDILKGKEITYELDSGLVKMDRVEGVLQPQSEPASTKAPAKKKK